jgi:hypothetical protein
MGTRMVVLSEVPGCVCMNVATGIPVEVNGRIGLEIRRPIPVKIRPHVPMDISADIVTEGFASQPDQGHDHLAYQDRPADRSADSE